MTADALAPTTTPSPIPTTLAFTITFHSRFRVGAAYPLDGLDTVTDLREPLPADHIKGLMRAEAARLLEIAACDDGLVDGTGRAEALLTSVFGTARLPSPWHWSEVTPAPAWEPAAVRSRVSIDENTGAARRDQLVMASATYAAQAHFCVETDSVISLGDAAGAHAALLRLAGRSVHHLGAWRRRGLGWVGVTPDSPNPKWSAEWDTITGYLTEVTA
jgi:hypothetical protein